MTTTSRTSVTGAKPLNVVASLVHQHRFGTTVTLHPNAAAAAAAIAETVAAWWSAENIDGNRGSAPNPLADNDIERFCELTGEAFTVADTTLPSSVPVVGWSVEAVREEVIDDAYTPACQQLMQALDGATIAAALRQAAQASRAYQDLFDAVRGDAIALLCSQRGLPVRTD